MPEAHASNKTFLENEVDETSQIFAANMARENIAASRSLEGLAAKRIPKGMRPRETSEGHAANKMPKDQIVSMVPAASITCSQMPAAFGAEI